MEYVQCIKKSVEYYENKLQETKDKLKKNVLKNPLLLKNVPILQTDGQFVFDAIQINGKAILYASESLLNDRNFVLKVIDSNPFKFGNYLDAPIWPGGKYELSMCISKNFRDDKEVMLKIVQYCGGSLQFASETFKNDRDIVIAAIQQYGYSYRYASHDLQNDYDIFMIVLKRDIDIMEIAPYLFRNDKEIQIFASINGGLQYVSEYLQNDRNIILKAVSFCGTELQFAPDKLKDDLKIVTKAIQQTGWSIQYASDKLRNRVDLMVLALEKGEENYIIQYATDTMKKNRKFLIFLKCKAFAQNCVL